MNVPSVVGRRDALNDRLFDATSLTNLAGIRLLIVDDELAHRNLLVVVLEQAGMTCLAVPSAKEALRLLQSESIDAVIADLSMPGISGLDLLAEVRRHYPPDGFLDGHGNR